MSADPHASRLLSTGHLRRAALEPEQRTDAVRRALAAVVRGVPVAGTALIRPCPDGEKPWRIEYAGERSREIRRWLKERIGDSLETTAPALTERPPFFPEGEPALFPLHPGAPSMAGLWVLWPYGAMEASDGGEIEHTRRDLEILIEVEHRERLCFPRRNDPLGPELARALRERDEQGLPAMLDLARAVSEADFAYWGSVHKGVVDVEWHLGARDSGFGFELPLGEGVGGRAFDRGETFEVADYRNCQYRYPGVSDASDSEDVRSVLAVPVRGNNPRSGAVLYAVRRTVAPFSAAERALLLRLKNGVEPAPGHPPAPRRLFASGLDHLRMHRAEMRKLLLASDRVRDAESWLERLVGGPVILADARGHPYVPGNLPRLERLQLQEKPRTVPLVGTNGGRGSLLLWPSVELPLEGWPDLLDDAAATFNVILDRAEHAHDRLNRQRSYWLQLVAEGRTGHGSLREGNRLGLPTENGEVWAFAWEPMRGAGGMRLPMLADDVVLDRLGGPFTVLEDGVGIVLLRGGPRKEPSSVRDELLRHLGPAPLWLVHGAAYESLDGLRQALLLSVRTVKDLQREDGERYVLEVHSRGLDSLLENPRTSEELAAFAQNMLKPLLDHDEHTRSALTRTFCLALAVGSPEEAARRLFVHPNTVRYRVRRAQEILATDLTLPKERTALSLAAFLWLRRNPAER